jgi:hypothetical protein
MPPDQDTAAGLPGQLAQRIAGAAGKSDFGAVNPAQLKPKAVGVTLETLNRVIAKLEKDGYIAVDEDAGTATVTEAGHAELARWKEGFG